MGNMTSIAPIKYEGLESSEKALARQMVEHISQSFEHVDAAAACWVQLQPETQARFIEATATGLRYLWERLERIGNKELHPLLWNAHGSGAKALAALPYDSQAHFLTHKIPVLVGNELRELDVTALSADQVTQVFRRTRRGVSIRDYQQQRRWILARERERQKQATSAARKVQSRRIERRGKWVIEKGLAHIRPALNNAGIDLETARQLIADLLAVRKP